MKIVIGIQTSLLIALFLMGCGASSGSADQGFTFKESPQGVELSENGNPVFFYQKEPKSANGEYHFNHYLHPLYSVNGDTLTEEFPDDHLHHRGVFWAWHQIYVGEKSLGDGWMMENFNINFFTRFTFPNFAMYVIFGRRNIVEEIKFSSHFIMVIFTTIFFPFFLEISRHNGNLIWRSTNRSLKSNIVRIIIEQ